MEKDVIYRKRWKRMIDCGDPLWEQLEEELQILITGAHRSISAVNHLQCHQEYRSNCVLNIVSEL